jgi:hypothetical protein
MDFKKQGESGNEFSNEDEESMVSLKITTKPWNAEKDLRNTSEIVNYFSLISLALIFFKYLIWLESQQIKENCKGIVRIIKKLNLIENSSEIMYLCDVHNALNLLLFNSRL